MTDPAFRASTRSADFRVALASLAVIGTALSGLGSVFVGRLWWFSTMTVVAAVLFIPVVLRALLPRSGRLGQKIWRYPAPWLGALLAATLMLTNLFAAPFAAWGFLPTVETAQYFGQLWELSAVQMRDGRAPLIPAEGFRFLLAVLCAALALLISVLTLALRTALPAMLLSLALYLAPLIVISPSFSPVVFVLYAVSVFWIYRETASAREPATRPLTRARSGIGALIVIALSIGAGVLAPGAMTALVPRTESGSAAGAGPFAIGIDPLVSLGNQLVNPEATLALTYTTTAPRAPYLKIVNIERFEGDVWGPDPFRDRPRNDVSAIGAAPGLSASISRTEVRTSISMERLATGWLPMPYPALSATGLSGAWSWEERGLAVGSQSSTTQNQEYEVSSLWLNPAADQLRHAPAPTGEAADPLFRDVPAQIPESVRSTAREITAGAKNNFDRALALQRYFRSEFSYSEQSPVDDAFGRGAGDIMASFLERKSGYCVHFSSTMAIMARELGIPSRLALGYLPGTPTAIGGTAGTTYRVTSNQLHAWPELYFEGIGWVPFEPTATRGVETNYDVDAAVPGASATPSATPTAPRASVAPENTARPEARPDRPDTRPKDSLSRTDPAVYLVPALGVLLVLLLFSGALIRALRRRARLMRGRLRSSLSGEAWNELVDYAQDLGFDPPRGASPRGVHRYLLAELPGVPVPARSRLLLMVEAESYAMTPVEDDPLALLAGAVAELRGTRSTGVRIIALLFPRSLSPRNAANGRTIRAPGSSRGS